MTKLILVLCLGEKEALINPRPEGYGSRLVIHSFILSPGTVFTSTPQRRHEQDRHVNISRFDSWILLKRWRSRVMAAYIDSRPVLQPSCGHAQLFNNSFCHDIMI